MKPIAFFLALCFSFSALSQEIDTVKLNAYFANLQAYDKLMGNVAIAKKGEILYAKSLGYAAVSGDFRQLANADTKYRIGSITKTFTAVMIMQCVEEGKLDLDETIETFFPNLRASDQITVRQLLGHKSGIHNFTDDPEYAGMMSKSFTREELLAVIRKKPLDFDPGTSFSYSNSGYVLLGFILEDLDEAPYKTILHNRISKPLSLENTYVGGTINTLGGEAQSYTYNNRWVPATETHSSVPGAAGNIVSTTTDLLRFLDALFLGELISEASLEAMKPQDSSYGLGLMEVPFRDYKGYGHTGGIDGFQSRAFHFPDLPLTIVQLANGVNYPMNQVSLALIEAGIGGEIEIPNLASVEVSEDDLKKCEGSFTSDQIPLEIKVWSQNGKLMAQATGQASFQLEAENPTSFRFDGAGLRLEFSELKKGKWQSMTLVQGGSFNFKRK